MTALSQYLDYLVIWKTASHELEAKANLAIIDV